MKLLFGGHNAHPTTFLLTLVLKVRFFLSIVYNHLWFDLSPTKLHINCIYGNYVNFYTLFSIFYNFIETVM